jgi:hypothetical protein
MLFNKAENGALEVKELIGFIYKSNTFSNLITYIAIAQRDIIRLIGKEVYKLAEDHYQSQNYRSGNYDNPEYVILDELVRMVQLPIILHAYRRYVPGSDLSHSESGRQITVTEDKKPAFEWMIERDNKNILDLAYESTDILLEWLDELERYVSAKDNETSNIVYSTWHGSKACIAQKDLFINTAKEFDSVFPINGSRRLYLALVPFVRETELRHIRPIIGSRYDEIKLHIQQDIVTDVEKHIVALAKVSIALLTISVAIKRLSVELLPDAVVQSFAAMDVRQSNTAISADRLGTSAMLERDGRRELIPLQNYIASLLPAAVFIEEETNSEQSFFMS